MLKLTLLVGLAASATGHLTHVCTTTTPGPGPDTCGKFVLWLGNWHAHSSTQAGAPGKAVVQLGQTIANGSPFRFAGGGALCTDSQVNTTTTTSQLQDHLRGSTFQSSCAGPVQKHLNDATVVTCYDGTQLTAIPGGGGFTPTMATGSAGCANSGASSWFFIELDADSSADLRVSLDGVDAVLSPVGTGACSMTTSGPLGTNSFYGRALTIPASELNIPGCGGGCAGAYAGPANGTSTGCGAGSSSGQICAVACNPGFNLVGGTVRCDDGAYVGSAACTDQQVCSQSDAIPVVSGLIGVTGAGCGVATAAGSACFFNCAIGSYSTGTVLCDPSTNAWIPSATAACHIGTGSGIGDIDDGGDPPCPGGTEMPVDYSQTLIQGPNFMQIQLTGSNFDPAADSVVVIPRTDCENPNCAQAASSASTTLSCTGGSTSLVCGDGVTTGFAPGADDGDKFKVCFCDGSARGGCNSLSDFGSNGPVIAVWGPAPTMAPSFSPAVAGAVPMISIVLEGNSASLTEPELAALQEAVLDQLLSKLSSNAAPIDRSEMFVKLSRESPEFTAEVFFKPASGVDIAEAHAIAAAIEAGSGGPGHFVTPDDGTTNYSIVSASARHSTQPPTMAPTAPPTANPTLSPTTSCERMLMVIDAHANGPDQDLFPLGPAGVALTDLSQSAMLSLRIELDESFGGSVEFTINDPQTGLSSTQLENNYPYTLMGDDNVVSNLDYRGWRATVGAHAVAIRIFTGKSRSGFLCARDVIFEVVASRDIPTSPPTSPPTPLVPTCDASAWPAVKGGRVCDKLAEPRGAAVCAAVIDFSQTEAATCSGYCTSLGLNCVDADDEKRNKCKVLQRTAAATTCSTVINAALGMDAICYCNAGPTFTPERAQRATAGDVSTKTGATASGSATVATAVVVTGGVVFVVIASMITVVRRRTRNTQRMPAGAVDLEWDAAETESEL